MPARLLHRHNLSGMSLIAPLHFVDCGGRPDHSLRHCYHLARKPPGVGLNRAAEY
jgi:hypothetical protein